MVTTGAYEFKLAAAAGPGGVIANENKIEKGEWAWFERHGERHWLSIYICCADCGFIGTLWRSYGDDKHGHQIDAQGNVSPSVGCPNPKVCGFHTKPTKLLGFVERRS